MKTNMGSVDKVMRILIAVAIGVLYFVHLLSGTLAVVLLVIAGIFLLTSLVGFCPLYAILGIHTNKQVK